MVFKNDAYQIRQFADLVNEKFNELYNDDQVTHFNTINNWFKDLESKRIHYINRSSQNQKIYDDDDLKIALFIMDKRKDSRWSLNGIYDALEAECSILRDFPIENNEVAEKDVISKEDIYEIMNEYKKEIIKEVLQSNEFKNMLPEPLDQNRMMNEIAEKIKQEKKTILEEQDRLREEAIKKWNNLPEEERLMKAGLFKKIENSAKKESFIAEYIKGHLII